MYRCPIHALECLLVCSNYPGDELLTNKATIPRTINKAMVAIKLNFNYDTSTYKPQTYCGNDKITSHSPRNDRKLVMGVYIVKLEIPKLLIIVAFSITMPLYIYI